MAAEEFRRGMDDDIRAVLDGADEVRRAERVVNDQRQSVLMGDFRDGVDVRDIAVRVAEGFEINRPRVVLDGAFHLGKIMGVHEGRLDAVLRQRMRQQVIGSAVNGLLCDDMSPVRSQRLNGVSDGRRTGSEGKRGASAFQRRDSLFQNVLGGIRQATVNVACIRQSKAVSRMLAVPKHIGSGLINRDGARVGRRIRLLLSHVKLQSLKFVIAHDDSLLLLSIYIQHQMAVANRVFMAAYNTA